MLLAAWVAVVLVFFSLAAAKRSVYLLPLFPALAVLLALGVAAAARPDASRAVLRVTSAIYAPALVLLGLAAGALASGVDVVAVLRHRLKPRDAQNTLAVVAGRPGRGARAARARRRRAACAAVLVARARRHADWRRLTLVVAAVTCAWHAVFGGFLHATLGRAASLAPFMDAVDRLVPPDASLHVASFPPDPGLRFYAPRPPAAVESQRCRDPPTSSSGRTSGDALARRQRAPARADRRERDAGATPRPARPPARARGCAPPGVAGQNG